MSIPSPAPSTVQSLEETVQWVNSLPPEQQSQLSDLVASSSLSLWAPNPGPQAMAYASEADETFYGGAAGGGKSALIAGLALTKHTRSLIIRRESTQLRGLIDDIARMLKTRDGLNKQDGQWRIPAHLAVIPGQLIEFGGVPNPGDEERHQGIAHDLLAFDEVTQLPEYIVNYLSTWNRTVDPDQRCRMVLTSNPPTPSSTYSRATNASNGLWLVRRYAPWLDPQYRDLLSLGPAQPGELRYFVTLDGIEQEHPDPLPFWYTNARGERELITPRSRTFIPALPTDNPYLGPQYISTLQKLPEPIRSAMLYGDFSVSLSDQPLQLFPSQWVRDAVARHRALSGSTRPPQADPMTSMGVDVARGGADSTVVVVRHGSYFAEPHQIPPSVARDGPDVALQMLKLRRENCPVVIDANGVGASVYDHCVSALGLDNIKAWVGSKGSTKRDTSHKYGFTNKRSEGYWKLREALDPGLPDALAIPDDPELLDELLAMTWEDQGNGRLKVIAKKDLTKLLGRSPDKADALMLAHQVEDEDSSARLQASSAREERLADARSHQDDRALQPLGGTQAHPLASRRSQQPRARWNARTLPITRSQW